MLTLVRRSQPYRMAYGPVSPSRSLEFFTKIMRSHYGCNTNPTWNKYTSALVFCKVKLASPSFTTSMCKLLFIPFPFCFPLYGELSAVAIMHNLKQQNGEFPIHFPLPKCYLHFSGVVNLFSACLLVATFCLFALCRCVLSLFSFLICSFAPNLFSALFCHFKFVSSFKPYCHTKITVADAMRSAPVISGFY